MLVEYYIFRKILHIHYYLINMTMTNQSQDSEASQNTQYEIVLVDIPAGQIVLKCADSQ